MTCVSHEGTQKPPTYNGLDSLSTSTTGSILLSFALLLVLHIIRHDAAEVLPVWVRVAISPRLVHAMVKDDFDLQ